MVVDQREGHSEVLIRQTITRVSTSYWTARTARDVTQQVGYQVSDSNKQHAVLYGCNFENGQFWDFKHVRPVAISGDVLSVLSDQIILYFLMIICIINILFGWCHKPTELYKYLGHCLEPLFKRTISCYY